MIKAVVFDLDNTLVDFMKMKEQSIMAAIDAMIDAGLKMDKEEARRKLFAIYDKQGIEYQRVFDTFFLEELGQVDPKMHAAGIVAYRKAREAALVLYPHVNLALMELTRRGLKLAVVSDAPRLQAWLRLCYLGLQHMFDYVVTYEDTGERKPSPAPFRKVLSLLDIRPEEERERMKQMLQQIWAQNRQGGQSKHRKKNGQIMEAEISSHEFVSSGKVVRLVVARDITEQLSLEQQLRQALKMEAVGRLAGGVAHDFNNLLMVIKGHTELLLGSLAGAPQLRKIEQIDRAASRAVSLTRQLLAFSRMQVLQPRVLVLNEIVEEMGKLLPRLIGEDIELVIRTAPDLGTIRADRSQMEQVLMNLAVNARDAMPSGGRLTIETCNADLDAGYHAKHPNVHPGRYVQLAVSDTGIGMDAETQAHIFEPFFTTKELGKGTGLGLATVYGVVKQSGGFIWVYSELDKGTSFKIYLPRLNAPAEKAAEKLPTAEVQRGTETILLAEDEQDVREVAREFLDSAGYTVLEAKNGNEALKLAEEHKGVIDLLMTDMVMPGISGQELAAQLRQKGAVARVVYMSGYAEQAALQAQEQDVFSKLLTKPFSRTTLLRTIREMISLKPSN